MLIQDLTINDIGKRYKIINFNTYRIELDILKQSSIKLGRAFDIF